MKPITKAIYSVLQAKGFKGSYILNISQLNNTLIVMLQLPANKEINDLIEILPNLQQELKAIDNRITERLGKRIKIEFALEDLTDIMFNNSYLIPDTLKIKLPTPFNDYELDFEDGASCHMLNGGAPRMGKTIFLLYLSTVLYLQTNGNIELYITSTKGKDFYPLMGLPNVYVSDENEDEISFLKTLETITDEYKRRNTLLYSPALAKATDSKSVKKLYPHMYHHFKPIFVIIDEYARFNFQPIHKLVAELVQTAGYVNVHIIIATQRPDARVTLPASIKMGLMTRICFRTADSNNSIVIIDEEGAESLPNIKGRAILKDGENHIVQVPLIKYNQCEELLNPFKEKTNNENNETKERPNDTKLTNKIQNLFKESVSISDIQPEHQSNKRMQPNNETSNNGWFLLASKTTKR
jgi:S-DNA-T family DNA segregation ATPase FtsK/SpoIIIE